MRLLVCGSRNYTDIGAAWLELATMHLNYGPITLVIHGGARGADTLADKWAITKDIRRLVYKPNWKEFGKAAGPIRNVKMLVEGRPDMVLAFPGGNGTADMVRQAKLRLVPVIQPYG